MTNHDAPREKEILGAKEAVIENAREISKAVRRHYLGQSIDGLKARAWDLDYSLHRLDELKD